MANSKQPTQKKPAKPRKDFPLFPHATGRWAKKIRGKFHYFGSWKDDPKGAKALEVWLDQRDDLLAGRAPRKSKDGFTVKDLCNAFMTAWENKLDSGAITQQTFARYLASCKRLVDSFGKNRLVSDLAADDFESLRKALAKAYGVHRLGTEVQHVRTILKYAFDAALIDRPVRVGPNFKKPSARQMRAHKHATETKFYEAAEIRQLLAAADQPMKAMILLGVNCGFGNSDVGTLPKSAVDLEAGWIDYPRPKTAIMRRCPLWPETVEAIREAIAVRPKAKDREDSGLLFITKYGGAWAKATSDNPVTKEFRKLLNKLKLHRAGVGFYALRHTFETIAGECRDQVAVNSVMGHVDTSMAAHYRERISDERLLAASDTVRDWLFEDSKEQ